MKFPIGGYVFREELYSSETASYMANLILYQKKEGQRKVCPSFFFIIVLSTSLRK